MSATRQGHLDPGDPLGLCFVSPEPGQVSATVESFRVARALRSAGMEVDLRGDGRCDVRVGSEGGHRTVTVQACWLAGHRVVLAPGLPPREDADAVLPLGEL